MVQRILNFDSVKEYLNGIDEKAFDLINFWKDKPEITNDEVLAKEFGEKITNIRSILSKLSYRGIVEYEKVKDKNSGWYHYYWKINFEKLAKLIYSNHKETREKIKEKLKIGHNYDVFTCKNKCAIVPFEVAAEYNFICPHCNEKLEYYDYNKEMEKMKEYLNTIENEMKIIANLLLKNKQNK